MIEQAVFGTPFGYALRVQCARGEITASDFVHGAAPLRERIRDPLLREARLQVRAYFRMQLRRFDLPLALHGTPFQVEVWSFVAQMETGEIVSYSDLARAIGSPRAARGVAAAMAKAPLDLFVPAHRVVGADGTVRGAAPNSLRRKLLALEGITLR